jgi:hypothetical protein
MSEKIVQFVCFITDLGTPEFKVEWENYKGEMENVQIATALHEKLPSTCSKYRYISIHPCLDDTVPFLFKKQGRSRHLHHHEVKVIQAGGYIPVQISKKGKAGKGEVKLIVCLSHDDNDIEFYKSLSLYRHLNIYQAYYESCAYGFILEFFVQEADAALLEQKAKRKPYTERGLYKELVDVL